MKSPDDEKAGSLYRGIQKEKIMLIGDEKETVSIMLYTSHNLRGLYSDLEKQASIADERWKEINERLEAVREKLRAGLLSRI